MSRMKNFIKKETVLSVAILLAVISVFLVLPDRQYLDYIDFRTLGILFSLMVVVAGLRQLGLFDWFAGRLLQRVHGIGAIATVLILLCFFSSMLITNDVSLITFVPFTIVLAHKMPTIITAYRGNADNCGKPRKYDDTDWQSTELVSVWKDGDECGRFY